MMAEVAVTVSAGISGGTSAGDTSVSAAGAQPPAQPGNGGLDPLGRNVPRGHDGSRSAARPQLIRALNEQLLLGHIRDLGQCSRAELARLSGLSKPTAPGPLATDRKST